jgi:hypothetical protein
MELNTPLKDQQKELDLIMNLDAQLRQKQSQEEIGQKCIDYLGQPRKQGKTFTKGWQGEVIAFNKLARFGYDVRFEKPCNYDLTIHGEKGISRIQVKSFFNHQNYQKVTVQKQYFKNKNESYSLTDFDFLAAVDVQSEEVYLVPISEIESSKNLGFVASTITIKKIKSYKI